MDGEGTALAVVLSCHHVIYSKPPCQSTQLSNWQPRAHSISCRGWRTSKGRLGCFRCPSSSCRRGGLGFLSAQLFVAAVPGDHQERIVHQQSDHPHRHPPARCQVPCGGVLSTESAALGTGRLELDSARTRIKATLSPACAALPPWPLMRPGHFVLEPAGDPVLCRFRRVTPAFLPGSARLSLDSGWWASCRRACI